MKYHGSIIGNLEAALTSAIRLRGKPVHADTMAYWQDLLSEARSVRRAQGEVSSPAVDGAIASLELELAERLR